MIGNHDDLRGAVDGYGLRFEHVPMTAETRDPSEGRMLELLKNARVDFIALARFMQILSPGFVAEYPERIINIHQAFERGVKIIGATSHYVTDELDEGPIIAQSTLPVDHRDTIDDLIRKGRDLERSVLATAVRLHIEDRILVNGNKTVVFH